MKAPQNFDRITMSPFDCSTTLEGAQVFRSPATPQTGYAGLACLVSCTIRPFTTVITERICLISASGTAK